PGGAGSLWRRQRRRTGGDAGVDRGRCVVMMTRAIKTVCGVLAALVLSHGIAAAQARPPAPPAKKKTRRPVYLSLSGGYQATANDFTDSATFTDNAEAAQYETRYQVKGGPALSVSGGATLWKQLGVGVGVTHFSH